MEDDTLSTWRTQVTERLNAVQTAIRRAAINAGRDADSVRLVAVTKYIAPAAAQILADVGVRDFGENRWQVARAKIELDLPVTWHFIGPLQSNKVRPVVTHFACIHSVDRISLAEAIALEAAKQGVTRKILVQVNITQEPQKSGVSPDALQPLLERIAAVPGLSCAGLMMIGRADAGPAIWRADFAALRTLRDEMSERIGLPLPDLSMGMSADFREAILEGATMIRIGHSLTG